MDYNIIVTLLITPLMTAHEPQVPRASIVIALNGPGD